MILDTKIDDYIKPKEITMGLNNKGESYIGFTYPKSEEQINETKAYLIKKAEEGEKINLQKALKNIKPYYNCYIKKTIKSLRIVTELDEEYAEQNFRYNLLPTDQTININTVKQVINKTYKPKELKTIFEAIIKQIKTYCYLKEEAEYQIIALYIILTYKYLYFDFMPIIHLNGEGGTGKSQVGKIMTKLGFNSSATVSTTSSSFFRRIDRKRGLYFMDEKENLQEHEKELLNGCVYEGNIHTVSEKEGDNYKDQEFNIYTPVVLACINDIYGATSTRTIRIETIRPPRNSNKYPVLRNTQDSEIWQNIRDELCIWSIITHKENNELMKVDKEMEALISNRGVDSWKLILNLSKKVGAYENLKKYIKNVYLEQVEEMHDNDLNYRFLKFLLKNNDRWIVGRLLYDEFCKYITDKQKEYFNTTRYGRLLRRVGFNVQNQNKRRTQEGYEYYTDSERISKYLRNNYEFTENLI